MIKRTRHKKMRYSWLALFVSAVLSLLLCACKASSNEKSSEASEEESETVQLVAMDTVMSITAYGENAQRALQESQEEIMRLDALLSVGDEDSEVYLINQNGGGLLSEDTQLLFEKAVEIGQDTNGLFDVAIYPMMQLWGFTNQEYRVPSENELKTCLEKIAFSKISYDSKTKELFFQEEGMGIDFGGIAKGYTSSRIMDIMKSCGIESGIVSLGGNVQVLGTKPDNSPWKIAIRDPQENENDYLGVLEAKDCAIITSGGYERYFEEGGVTYHHIIDPRTGYPSESGLTSVTIVSSDGMLADALSTTLFVMGKEEAIEYWRNHSTEFDFILFDGKQLYITSTISEKFKDSPYQINVITKE